MTADAQFPDIPTFDELGFSMGTLSTWERFCGRQGRRHQHRREVGTEIDQMPYVQQKMRRLGYEPLTSESALRRHREGEATAWKAAVDEATSA